MAPDLPPADTLAAVLSFAGGVTASLLEEQKFSKLLLDSLPGIFYLYSYPDLRLLRWNQCRYPA